MCQNARLDLITYMKELGMSLKEIKELLDQEDLNLIEAVLIKKRQAIDDELATLKRQKAAVNRTIYSLERYITMKRLFPVTFMIMIMPPMKRS